MSKAAYSRQPISVRAAWIGVFVIFIMMLMLSYLLGLWQVFLERSLG
ncbi:hypothetical protein B4123_4674 [Bacillus paralicheniformis]|uniref:Uncharacterized protein n=1 Tax=Bacillus paralicheniformis TaxID=1648923 RepID=A0ABY3FPC1_9BACI|nr:hypothetical protein SC10_B2orf02524 [Bacillus paralicheniformis]OLF99679.1 hypothetical protein B4123_4674 [Bacillus paralicheniformis]OLG07011.1 hypothetical protein B4125_1192 [Bacillus paralicheniformis]TWJ54188.1 hypothetical protein CHCC5022_1032 [Bacillus paralicheniformis]TWJ55429.1 hypothetical protein CHCC5023_2627 [Bacillus paralicheniformis]